MPKLTLEQLKKDLQKEFREQDNRFDKKLGGVEKRLGQKIETEVGNLAAMTAREFSATQKGFQDLKEFITKENEELAAISAREFAAIRKELNVQERVTRLERDMAQIKSALHISA